MKEVRECVVTLWRLVGLHCLLLHRFPVFRLLFLVLSLALILKEHRPLTIPRRTTWCQAFFTVSVCYTVWYLCDCQIIWLWAECKMEQRGLKIGCVWQKKEHDGTAFYFLFVLQNQCHRTNFTNFVCVVCHVCFWYQKFCFQLQLVPKADTRFSYCHVCDRWNETNKYWDFFSLIIHRN